jgi:hypothetical protein
MLGIRLVQGAVLPEWFDVNEHMNVAYYVLAFDQAVDSSWEEFGITEDYINVSSSSTFAARQGDWGWPPEAGKQMTVPHPIYSARTDD